GIRDLIVTGVQTCALPILFTALEFASGRTWSRAGRWQGRELQPQGDAVELGEGHAPIRVLHDGPGLDRARFPAAATRFVARALTGALHERRWLARPARSGWAVHERVSFGIGGQA